MLKKLFRTSRWVVQREINTIASATANNLRSKLLCRNPQVFPVITRRPFTEEVHNKEIIDPLVFDEYCSETLESLCDYFELIVDQSANFKGADVTFSDGVLTVDLGKQYGIYVINRQTPNKQIWLSSPVSGPKRYDLELKNGGYWVYKHDGVTLHKLLQEEIEKIAKSKIDFSQCSHSSL